MENKDYNFNYSECLKEKDNLTSREIVNVCNGEVTKINYGAGDWAIIIVMFLLFVSIIGLLISFIINLIRDM